MPFLNLYVFLIQPFVFFSMLIEQFKLFVTFIDKDNIVKSILTCLLRHFLFVQYRRVYIVLRI